MCEKVERVKLSTEREVILPDNLTMQEVRDIYRALDVRAPVGMVKYSDLTAAVFQAIQESSLGNGANDIIFALENVAEQLQILYDLGVR